MPEPGKLLGKINWRINKGDDDFIERSTTQKFVQARIPHVCVLVALLHNLPTCLAGSAPGHGNFKSPVQQVP